MNHDPKFCRLLDNDPAYFRSLCLCQRMKDRRPSLKLWGAVLLAIVVALGMVQSVQGTKVIIRQYHGHRNPTTRPKPKVPPKPKIIQGTINFISADGLRLWVTLAPEMDYAYNQQYSVEKSMLVVTDGDTQITIGKARNKHVCDLALGNKVTVTAGPQKASTVKSITTTDKGAKNGERHLLGIISVLDAEGRYLTVTPEIKEPDGRDIKVVMDDKTTLTINGAPGKNKDLLTNDRVDVILAITNDLPVSSIQVTSSNAPHSTHKTAQ